jgi:hypothetical protein
MRCQQLRYENPFELILRAHPDHGPHGPLAQLRALMPLGIAYPKGALHLVDQGIVEIIVF